jgi:hypothetical protein
MQVSPEIPVLSAPASFFTFFTQVSLQAADSDSANAFLYNPLLQWESESVHPATTVNVRLPEI